MYLLINKKNWTICNSSFSFQDEMVHEEPNVIDEEELESAPSRSSVCFTNKIIYM